MGGVLVQFTKATRRHRIGRTHTLHVIATAVATRMVTNQGADGWLYIGYDETGRELEVITVELADPQRVLVVHVMPTALRRK